MVWEFYLKLQKIKFSELLINSLFFKKIAYFNEKNLFKIDKN